MRTLGFVSPGPVFGGLGVLMVGLTFACGPAAAPTPTPVATDPFAVVRATSQAAYQAGQTLLANGDLQGCPLIDLAKTADPDNRPEIEQALERCLTAIAQITPAATPTAGQRTIVVATLGLDVLPAPLTPGPSPVGVSSVVVPKPSAAAVEPPAVALQTGAHAPTGASQGMLVWPDPQGRFSIGAPTDWVTQNQPQALFGTGVVQFQDPSGLAELSVAVDSGTKAVSPELYAASMDIAMQQQVPGYADEQVVPGSTAGQPSVRRVFTFTQRDLSGHDLQARSFQVTLLQGSTPYIISGSAPAAQFEQFVPTFDAMVATFRFS